MRITSINLSAETCAAIGLGFPNGIQIKNPGDVVGLFGKNGVGKTRLLRIIHKLLSGGSDVSKYLLVKCILRKEFVFDFSEDTVKTAMDNLLFKQEEALVYAKYNYNKIKYGDNDSQTKNLQSNYNTMAYADRDNIKKSIDKISGYVQKHVVFLKHDLLIKLTDIIDSRTVENITVSNFKDSDIEMFQKKILPYLNQLIQSKSPDFEILQKLFNDVTGKTIEIITGDDKPAKGRERERSCFKNIKIANDLCKYEDLSDGEKVMFTLCLLLFYYKQKNRYPLSNSILIYDEPERNLHPEAIIRLLIMLHVQFNPDQIFLASHSIDVLASLKYSEIFHVQSDTSDIQRSLNDLVHELAGNCYRHTQQLYNSLADWSYYNFLVQCCSDPVVIDAVNKEDPQVKAFIERIKVRLNNKSQKNKLQILEIGAGSGRVYKSSKDNLKHCEFYAYEPNQAYKSELIDLGINLWEPGDKKNFDIILFCNVLHEISPEEWIGMLNTLIECLNDDGEFIFIERNVLTVGEHAHQYDFFVLGCMELAQLFNIDNKQSLVDIVIENPKISCVPVEKKLLNKVTQLSIKEAIKSLQTNSLTHINTIKEQMNDKNDNKANKMKLGYELAFYSIQYINCTFFLLPKIGEKS